MTAVPQNDGLSFADWAAEVSATFPALNIPDPSGFESWADWAAQVVELPEFADDNAPTAYGFSDWREWADAFVGASDG